jgi:hypothetical protein
LEVLNISVSFNGEGYAQISRAHLHRTIMGMPPGYKCDHIDGNKNNCQRANLQRATPQQNSQKQHSKLCAWRGLHRRPTGWFAQVQFRPLGRHPVVLKVSGFVAGLLARDAAARALNLPGMIYNLPRQGERFLDGVIRTPSMNVLRLLDWLGWPPGEPENGLLGVHKAMRAQQEIENGQ